MSPEILWLSMDNLETNNLDELIEVMVFSFLCKVGSIIVGTLFPCFSTYKAAKRRDGPMQKFYGEYWTIFGCLSSIEAMADALYLTSLVPEYQMVKFVFLLWISTGGASFVYNKVVFPLMKKHEKRVDEIISSTGRFALKAAGNLFSKALSSALTSMAKIPTATTPIIASAFFEARTSQSASRVPTQQAVPSRLRQQVLRSLSVEEIFQPATSYSARVVEFEEMDDEGLPLRDMPGPSSSQRPMEDFKTVIRVPTQQATPSLLHRQVLGSLSVEETFQPGASYSARGMKFEEMDNEGWESRDILLEDRRL